MDDSISQGSQRRCDISYARLPNKIGRSELQPRNMSASQFPLDLPLRSNTVRRNPSIGLDRSCMETLVSEPSKSDSHGALKHRRGACARSFAVSLFPAVGERQHSSASAPATSRLSRPHRMPNLRISVAKATARTTSLRGIVVCMGL